MRNIVSAILLLFAAAVIGFIYFSPEWTTYQTLRARINELKAIREELANLSAQRDILKQKLGEIPPENLSRLALALPEGEDRKNLMILFERRTIEDGVKLKSIALSTESPAPQNTSQPIPGGVPTLSNDTLKEIAIQISVESSYLAFKKFLSNLEQSLRLIDVFDLSFGVPQGENTPFTLRAKTYYQ